MNTLNSSRSLSKLIGIAAVAAAICGVSWTALSASQATAQASSDVVTVATDVEWTGDIAEAPDGGLVVAVGDYGRQGSLTVARFTPAGPLDTAFGEAGFATGSLGLGDYREAKAVAVQKDGKIVAAGFWQFNGGRVTGGLISRFNSDGTLDASFGKRGNVIERDRLGGMTYRAMTIQRDGRILVAGGVNELAGGKPGGAIVRYLPNGSVDRAFGTKGKVVVKVGGAVGQTALLGVQALPNGKIVAGGYANQRLVAVRFHRNGKPDLSFGTRGRAVRDVGKNQNCSITPVCKTGAMGVDRRGRVVVMGNIDRGNGLQTTKLIRFTARGKVDQAFGKRGVVAVRVAGRGRTGASDIAVLGNGKIMVADGITGSFPVIGYTAKGRLDTSFGTNGASFSPGGGIADAVTPLRSGGFAAAGRMACNDYRNCLAVRRTGP